MPSEDSDQTAHARMRSLIRIFTGLSQDAEFLYSDNYGSDQSARLV